MTKWLQFNDDDIVEVYYGEGYEIDPKQEYLGKATYYQGASKLVFSKLESIGIFDTTYIRHVGAEYGVFIDYGSHSHFFKLRVVKE
jgi:hypothetical protein